MGMEVKSPRYIIAGSLNRDFIIFPSGEALLDVPGGNVLYTAVGLAIWEPEPPPGIIARIGEDFPQSWLKEFSRRGIDIRGVNVLPKKVDVRYFTAFVDGEKVHNDPVKFFSKAEIPFPKSLLGYKNPTNELDSRTKIGVTSIRKSDFLPEYLGAGAVHIAPLDFLSHNLLPALMHHEGFSIVTLDPSPGYMNATFWGNIPSVVNGLTAFLPSEEEVRSLFRGRSSDLWEMAEALANYGCEIVVIKCGESGQLVYEKETGYKWEIPSYPSRQTFRIGAGDAFNGGFLVGYRRTFDPVEAALYGNISASIVLEGKKALYGLGALPGLADARLESLRQFVRKL
jgi:ribokinase